MEVDDINRFHNIHSNDVFYVIGNSPAINDWDLASLGNIQSKRLIGLNAATLKAHEIGLPLDYHVMTDWRFLREKRSLIEGKLSRDTVCFWGENIRGHDDLAQENTIFFLRCLGEIGFSTWLPAGFFSGYNTSVLALQVAYFLGARIVYLVGVDLTYFATQPRFYQTKRGADVDLHVRGRQIRSVWLANLAFRRDSRRVFCVGEDTLLRGYLPNVPFEVAALGARSRLHAF